MSTATSPTESQTFMVFATLRADTDFTEFNALREDEQKQLEVLRSDGRIGAHYVSLPRRATFIEVIAADEQKVAETERRRSLRIEVARSWREETSRFR